MRRMMAMGALALVLVLGSATIGHAGGSDVREPSTRQGTAVEERMIKFDRWVERFQTRAKVDCDTLTCLNNYLTRLSKDTAKFERFVNDFVDSWNDCIRINPLTRYGFLDGSEGYVYELPDGTTIKITAIDYTVDPVTEPFRYFMSWRTAAACPVLDPA